MKQTEQKKGARDQQRSAGGGALAIAVVIVLIGVLTAIGWGIALG